MNLVGIAHISTKGLTTLNNMGKWDFCIKTKVVLPYGLTKLVGAGGNKALLEYAGLLFILFVVVNTHRLFWYNLCGLMGSSD